MDNKLMDIVKRGYVKYSDFGAVGDGIHNDHSAIYDAHVFANEHGLDVFADEGATYYIHTFEKSAPVKTNTDFSGAKFIIDDTGDEVFKQRTLPVFVVEKDNPGKAYTGYELNENFDPAPIKEGDTSIPWLSGKLEAKSLLIITNAEHRDFIRFGSNVNSGNPRVDCLLVDTNGDIDPDTPVAFSFDKITKIEIFRTDDKPIIVKGGYFESICCRVVESTEFENKWRGYYRAFKVIRSNTTISDMTHRMIDEPDIPNEGYGRGEDGKLRQSYPYYGFVYFYNTYGSYAKNLALNAHTTYFEDKPTSTKPVDMGSYDLVIEYSSHVFCEGITNGVDINDKRYWGIMSSNGAKNLEFKNCSMSRFDAHRGFWNARLIGCEFGQTINVIGGGNLEIIDTVRTSGHFFLGLRNDYGSTFRGNITLKNCSLIGRKKYRGVPNNDTYDELVVINCGFQANTEKYLDWDFGYTCYMPINVHVENFKTSVPNSTYLFNSVSDAAFNPAISNQYQLTKSVTYKNTAPLPICKSSECTAMLGISVKAED